MTYFNHKLIESVRDFARSAHKNDVRKFGVDKGKSYFGTHVTRVAACVFIRQVNEDQYIAAWLHDVKEDHPDQWDVDVLKEMGVSDKSIEIVDALSKKDGENYFDFIQRITKTPEAIIVKIADITDNMKDINEGSLKDKYRFALHMLKSEKNCNDWVAASNNNTV